MAAVAVDLSPVVETLLRAPFDRATLERAQVAVGGHPQAYATALRCAAKRTRNTLAAAYWFIEAARVHELEDDLGGAIALLSRAHACDPTNVQAAELLAACMTRLAMRSGLAFTFTPGPAAKPKAQSEPAEPSARNGEEAVPLESYLRPPAAPAARERDTLPGLFDPDTSPGAPEPEPEEAVEVEAVPEGAPAPAVEAPAAPVATVAPAPALVVPVAPAPPATTLAQLEDALLRPQIDLPPLPQAAPETARQIAAIGSGSRAEANARRVAPMLPPSPDSLPSVPIPLATKIERQRPAPEPEEVSAPTVRSSEIVPRGHAVYALEAPIGDPGAEAVYGEMDAPPTVRPVGDGLVGALFEALHALHFVDDIREGAEFVGRVLHEKMRPSTVLVHLYDINSGHLVVVSARGSRADVLLDYATPEDEALVAEVMKGDEATLVIEPASDPRLGRGRWLLAEPRRSVLCAPAVVEGRYLGLVEIADPVDGAEFTENDRNALTYVAGAFARFLDRRGIVFSEEDQSPEATERRPAELRSV